MVDGIIFAANLARSWEELAKRVASGDRTDRLLARLSEIFTEKEVSVLGAYFGANACAAISRALETCASDETTDPDVTEEITDPYLRVAGMVPPWGPIDEG